MSVPVPESNGAPMPHEKSPVVVGFLIDQFDTSPKTVEIAWGKLCTYFLTNHEESPCTTSGCRGKDCPHKSRSGVPKKPMALVPGVVEGSRVDKNVRVLTLLVLDFDHLTGEEAAGVEAKFAQANVERVLYTTHNHRDDEASFRVVVLLSRPVSADQWHRFLPAAVGYLGVSISKINEDGKMVRQPDPVCKNRSRLYYLPSHPKGAPHGAEHVPGQLLDVDVVLAWGVGHAADLLDPSEETGAGLDYLPIPDSTGWDKEMVSKVARAAAERFPSTGRRHEFCMALAGMLRRAGATEDTARAIVREAARAGGSSNSEARASSGSHTYALGDEAELTGFTRLAEIVGDEAARDVGGAIVDARHEALLRDLGEPPEIPEELLETVVVPGDSGETKIIPFRVPKPVVDLADVRKRISSAAAGKARSLDRNDRIAGVLLRRLLAGEALSSGAADKETVREGCAGGLDPDEALRLVLFDVAVALPVEVPYEALSEVLRASLVATSGAPEGSWTERAKKHYKRALRAKRIRQLQSDADARKSREAILSSGDEAPPRPEQEVEEAPPDPAWKDELRRRGDGSLAQIPHNARVLLECDPAFRGAFAWNDVTKKIVFRRTAGPLVAKLAEMSSDALVAAVQDVLGSAAFDLVVSFNDVGRRVLAVARKRPFDPLANFLRSIRHDGEKRAETWLSRYCGAEDTAYTRIVGKRWLIGLVARGLRPGTKFDHVLVMEADQGTGKSTAFEILGGEFYCESSIVLGDKDSRLLAGRYWICELAELVAFRKTGHDAMKGFLASRKDSFRPPYGREYEDFLRRCVFVGSTNDSDYLTDETGNRRYLCVKCSFVPGALRDLRRDRELLLAEAVALYNAASSCPKCLALQDPHDRCPDHRWWFAYDEKGVTEDESGARVLPNPVYARVEAWWYGMHPNDRPREFTSDVVAEKALDANAFQIAGQKGILASIGRALEKLGFKRRRDGHGLRLWRYYPIEELVKAPQRTAGSGKTPLSAMSPFDPKKKA